MGPHQQEGVAVERALPDRAVELNSTVWVCAFDNDPCLPNTALPVAVIVQAVNAMACKLEHDKV